MWILTILTSLLNKNIFIIGGLVGAIALGGWGGWQLAKAKYVGEKYTALENLIEQQEEIARINSEIDQEVNETVEVIKWKERIVIEEVIKYVEDNPDFANCELDAHGLQLWNSSVKE